MASRQRCRTWMQGLRIVALLALAAGSAGLSAIERDYLFERLDGDGLTLVQGTVHALAQDRYGFLWIGTQGGLHRFDGHDLRVWRHHPTDASSLPDNFVTALAEDERGELWVGHQNGAVSRIDPGSGRPQTELTADAARAAGLGAVHDLLIEPGLGVWLADADGVLLMNRADGSIERVLDLESVAAAARPARALARSPQGDLLVASADGALAIAPDRSWRRLGQVRDRPSTTLLIGRRGTLWLGAADGLLRLEAGRWQAVDLGVTRPRVSALVADDQDRLWVALGEAGLLRLDADGSRRHLRHDRYLPSSLPEDRITRLLVDDQGLLWVGGVVHGVSRTPVEGARFRTVADRAGHEQPRYANNVRAVAESPSGELWLGFEGEGLKRLRGDGSGFDDLTASLRGALGLGDDEAVRVQALAFDDDGRLWIATTEGLVQRDPTQGRLRSVARDLLPSPNLRSLMLGDDGSLWVGGFQGGLTRLWPDSARHALYRHDPTRPASLSSDAVMALAREPGGAVWVGTLGGLDRLDPGSGDALRLRHDRNDPHSLSNDLVRALLIGSDGTLWIGTHAGLNRLDAFADGAARFSRFLPSSAGFDDTVYAIVEDDHGRLWLSGNRGILCFDPSRGHFHGFAAGDGLQGLEYNGGAATRRSNGELAFGGTQGLNLFRPQDALRPSPRARIHLTSVRVGAGGDERVAGIAPPRIAIEHDQRVVSFGFVALDLLDARRHRYAWRLVGFDDEWIEGDSRREATYTNLPPGTYTLEIRSRSRDDGSFGDGTSIVLDVLPPWWATAGMKVVYAAMMAALFLLAWRMALRRRQLRRQYAVQLREREDRLKLALWGSGDEFWDWDVANNRFYRLGADQLLGFVETEQQMSSDDWRHRAVHQDDRERVERVLAEHLAGRTDYFESEHRIRDAQGAWVWVRSRGKVVERDAEGRPLRICGTARNITDSRRAERERRIAAEVIRSMSEGVSVVGLDFRFVSVNPAFGRITGYDAEDVLGEDAGMLNGAQHAPEEYRQIRQELERNGHWHGELWQRRKDGEDILCWLESTEVRDGNGNRTHYVAVLTDITDRKRAEQELRYLANYDTLTGLPNRTLLGERLAHAVIRARRQTTKIGVLFLDLDRFKHVNDSMGHAMGDRLLKAAGARLRLTVRDTDTVARLGGDEFTVVLEDIHTVTQAERVAQKILEAFAHPLELDGRQDVVISPSIGIAMYPDHGQVPTDLLKFADTAMYQAKDRGRNTYQVYAETMDAEARLRATMVGALRRALDRGEFRLVYQPKLSLLDDSFTGVEALLRWDSEELGPIPPTTFIPLAEETGLIIAIGEWVLREACMQIQAWTEAGLEHLTVAVNVSVLQLFRGELGERLADIVREYGIAPERLELELTESMVMANAEQSINTLRNLKAIGVNLAIDDFGTGYSSLAYLKRLPIDTLKIDKEFVGDITTDPDDEAITATIIAMAHSLGLNVVAEGVETEEQLLYLREQRCDEVQGFWLSAPLEAERCTAFLLSRQKAQTRRRRAART